MAKKPKRKPALTLEIKEQIRSEFSFGARVSDLSRKYARDKSIVSRIVNGVSRDGEKLASNLATINQELATYKQHEQEAILQRSEQIRQIKEATLKGTNYIAVRTLRKLQGLKDDKASFNDLLQAQGVMTKANALVEPKVANQVNVNTQVNNVQMSKAKVKAELVTEGIPDDVLNDLGYLNE